MSDYMTLQPTAAPRWTGELSSAPCVAGNGAAPAGNAAKVMPAAQLPAAFVGVIRADGVARTRTRTAGQFAPPRDRRTVS